MREKKAVTRELHKRYVREVKREKTTILSQFTLLTGYNRSYAARVLRKEPKAGRKEVKHRVKRRIYEEEVFHHLRKIWTILRFYLWQETQTFPT